MTAAEEGRAAVRSTRGDGSLPSAATTAAYGPGEGRRASSSGKRGAYAARSAASADAIAASTAAVAATAADTSA